MGEVPSTSKVCTICGIDVSAKPRTKDSQGRYLCQDCVEKARQAQGALKNPPPKPASGGKSGAGSAAGGGEEDNSFLLGMGAKNAVAETGTKACPECGRALTMDSVICVGCGYNSETGRRTAVRVLKAEKPKDGSAPKPKGEGLGKNPHVIGGIALLAIAALAAVGFLSPDLAMPVGLALRAFTFIVHIWVVVVAWREELWSGVGCLLCGLYEIYWVLVRSENPLMKWLYMAGIVGVLVSVFLSPQFIEAISGGGGAGGP